MSLVSSAVNSPYRGTGRRLSPGELIGHGRAYLTRCGLPADSEDVALQVGYTLALVGPSASLQDDLKARLARPKPEPEPEPEPEPDRKRAWGLGRTARLELRLSPHERDALAAMAAIRGESVAEYIRDAAAHHLATDEVLMREREQALRVRRLDATPERPKPEPSEQDWEAMAERAKDSRERWRAASARLRSLRDGA